MKKLTPERHEETMMEITTPTPEDPTFSTKLAEFEPWEKTDITTEKAEFRSGVTPGGNQPWVEVIVKTGDPEMLVVRIRGYYPKACGWVADSDLMEHRIANRDAGGDWRDLPSAMVEEIEKRLWVYADLWEPSLQEHFNTVHGGER